MNRFSVLILFILVLGSLPLSADDEYSQLQLQAYSRDIAAYSDAELQAWLERIALTPARGRDAMQKQLYKYYGIEPEKLSVQSTEPYTLRILSAQRLVLHRIDPLASSVTLSGGVHVEVILEAEKNSTEITASRIIIEQYSGTLQAYGDVTITTRSLETGEVLNTLQSELVLFDINAWNGRLILPRIVSEQTNIDGERILFFLQGGSAERSASKQLIIEDGIIGTAVEDPHFSLEAGRIVLLENGDWFAEDALFKLGRVPVFYLPFFYYPGRTLVFNPAFGVTTDRGLFFNTTIPLFGILPVQRETAANSVALFIENYQDAGSGSSPVSLLDGFLTADSPFADWVDSSESYAALLMDAYEQTGTALGAEALLQNREQTLSGTLFLMLGYSPQESQPFRLLAEPELSLDGKMVDIEISVPFYSDAAVAADFGVRKSTFALDDITGRAVFPLTRSDLSSFSWELNGSYMPELPESGILTKLALSRFSSSVQWDITSPWSYTITDINAPRLTFSLAGTLLDWQGQPPEPGVAGNEQIPVEDRYGLAGDAHAFTTDDGVAVGSLHRFPELLPDGEQPDYDPLHGAGNQAVSVPDVVSMTFALRNESLSDFNFSDDSVIENLKHVFNIALDFDTEVGLLDGSLQISNGVATSLYLQKHNYFGDDDAARTVLDELDSKQSRITLFDMLQVTLPELGVTYVLSGDMLRYGYDAAAGKPVVTGFSFDEQFIRRHYVTGKLPLEGIASSLLLKAVLPPAGVTVDAVWKTALQSLSIQLDAGLSLIEDSATTVIPNPVSGLISFDIDSFDLSGSLNTVYDLAYHLGSSSEPVLDSGDLLELQGLLRWQPFPELSFSQRFTAMPVSGEISRYILALQYKRFSAELTLRDSAAAPGLFAGLLPDTLQSASLLSVPEVALWYDRIILSGNLYTSLYYNFLDPVDNLLSFRFSFEAVIREFLTMKLQFVSKNTALHTYVDGTNFIIPDLLKSFNFFHIADRYASNFNLYEVSLDVVHEMRDWNLVFDYTGEIALDQSDLSYAWDSTYSIYIKWKAIPEIDLSSSIEHDITTGGYTIDIE